MSEHIHGADCREHGCAYFEPDATTAPTPNETPRLCPAHFGMHDVPCFKDCGDICVTAQPEKVNQALADLRRQLADWRELARRNEPLLFDRWQQEHDRAEKAEADARELWEALDRNTVGLERIREKHRDKYGREG